MANRTLAALRKFFNWCMERDLINSPPLKISPRPRTLDKELKDIWNASQEQNNRYHYTKEISEAFTLWGIAFAWNTGKRPQPQWDTNYVENSNSMRYKKMKDIRPLLSIPTIWKGRRNFLAQNKYERIWIFWPLIWCGWNYAGNGGCRKCTMSAGVEGGKIRGVRVIHLFVT